MDPKILVVVYRTRSPHIQQCDDRKSFIIRFIILLYAIYSSYVVMLSDIKRYLAMYI